MDIEVAGTKRIASRIEIKSASEPGLGLDTELKLKQETDLLAIAKTLDCKEYKYEINQFETEVDRDDSISIRAADPTPVFYYHPDHLGTSTVISNSTGALHQYFFNLPFGEPNPLRRSRMSSPTPINSIIRGQTMIEGCTNSTYELNYKFNAKELDAESGMYYYGARYYDPRISVWMSADPMWEKRSWVSPYSYCQNNPFGRIDPTGALDGWYTDEKGTTIYDAKINCQADLNSSGIKGSYIGHTFSGILTNGWGVTGDAKGGLTMYLPEYTISANKNSSSFLYSDAMNYIGYGLSGGSIASGFMTTFGNLGSKMSLFNDGMFLGNYGGSENAWKLGFKGNKYVSSSLVAAEKSKFLNNIGLLKGAKAGGYIFGGLGVGISIAQFSGTNDQALKFEYGFDTFMGSVGFMGLPGAAASGLYFGIKPLIKFQTSYINQATSGFSEFGMGFNSINLMPTK